MKVTVETEKFKLVPDPRGNVTGIGFVEFRSRSFLKMCLEVQKGLNYFKV